MLLLDRFVKIYRLSQVEGNKTSFLTFTTSVNSTVQPLGDEKTALYGGSFGKMYKIYVDVDKDIKERDQIRDYLGNIYEVVSGGLENRNDGFIADYMGITVKKIN